MRQTLIDADEVIIVATPDLACLRNTKSLIDQLNPARGKESEVVVALSMMGAPKRPEISFKDFAQAVGATPVAALAFEPSLFTAAEIKGRRIGEIAPQSKAAATFEALAAALTGRNPAKRKPFLFGQAGGGVEEAAPERDQYLVTLRKRAEESLNAPAKNQKQNRRERRGKAGALFRFAAVAIGFVAPLLVGVWYMSNQSVATANAAPPAAAAEPPAPRAPDAASQYREALRMIEAHRAVEAAPLLRASADHGYALAQYRLAKLYERGDGVRADLAVARELTERAAAGGNVRAMHDLGVYYARGEGAPLDEAAAYRWFRQAAGFGVADSQFNLGVLYEQGRGGVSADAQEALFWFMLAAAQGDQNALARQGALEANLTPMQIEAAQMRAEAFQPREPDAGAN
jgi:TPR repeat protein